MINSYHLFIEFFPVKIAFLIFSGMLIITHEKHYKLQNADRK